MKQATKPAVVLTGLLLAAAWVIIVAITVPQAQSIGPQPNGDYGFFTAVAERLWAGDRLYVDIWDNKDPFVFYSISLARTAGIWGAWTLEILWMGTAALAVYSIGRWSGASRHLSLLVGGAFTPLLMVGLPYFMGSTHIPGIALTLVAVAVTLRERPVVTGLVLSALVFFKLIMFPLGLVLVTVAVLTRSGRPSRIGTGPVAARIAIGFSVGLAATSLLLGVRGELVPYVQAQVANVLYSQTPIVPETDPSPIRWIARHVVTLVNPHVFLVIVTTLILVGWTVVRLRKQRTPQVVSLAWMTGAAFLMEGLIVAAVSKWLHHALIFAVSSALVLVILAALFSKSRFYGSALGVIVLALLVYPLMGAPSPLVYLDAISSLDRNIEGAQRTDRLTSALAEYQPSSVAIIGQGNLVPRSFELTNWSLACRHIAQRHFDPPRNFEQTLACLPDADVIIIAPDAEARDGFADYNAFLEEARQVAESERRCSIVETFMICVRPEG